MNIYYITGFYIIPKFIPTEFSFSGKVSGCISTNIGTVVIGKNDNWKQGANIGKKNNQNFTQIPHCKLIQQITYKCELAGIKVMETERLLHQ
ncbi:IS200/IS605 family accessory protein TnpB-related protein [Okeania sp. SIO2C9]|uniref:IS200/IS605 family accessory protein TnpB-related protein n=1 Tax=Okeania sp. SIO2C9 TaxID=2607791 RepID=UPI0025F7A7A1|nr:IS200/IS605 family accessory protein TnpB-related protein [Okeania sp. SIO2C9]